jgi:hypothetical protein
MARRSTKKAPRAIPRNRDRVGELALARAKLYEVAKVYAATCLVRNVGNGVKDYDDAAIALQARALDFADAHKARKP